MHKILLAIAIFSTILLVQQVRSEDAKSAKEIASPTNQNEALSKAFEETKKSFSEDKKASTLVKNAMKDMQLIPQEKDMKGFPEPFAQDENDPAKIAVYYKSVSESYEKEMKKAAETMTRAHEASQKQKTQAAVKYHRHDNIKQPMDINKHKGGLEIDEKVVPFKSAPHTPLRVHGDAQILQDKRYNELKSAYETLELKYKFYSALTQAMGPK